VRKATGHALLLTARGSASRQHNEAFSMRQSLTAREGVEAATFVVYGNTLTKPYMPT
jgi:hypothetical protein